MGTDPVIFVFRALAVLFALSAHEYAHAAVAQALGDRSQGSAGRLTLNPLAHLDPIGTLLLLFAGFGWAKPVQVNPYAFRSPKTGMIYVSLAGPACNILLAVLFALPFRLGVGGSLSYTVQQFLYLNFYINLVLAAFNLIPIPPLDGSKVLAGVLPGRQAYEFARLEAYGPLLLMLLIVTHVTDYLMNPIMRALQWLVLGGGM